MVSQGHFWSLLRSFEVKIGPSRNRNELIDYSISIYNLNELLLNIPLLVYMPSNEQSIRVPLPTTRDNLKKYIEDDFILDGKVQQKLMSTRIATLLGHSSGRFSDHGYSF